MARASDVNTRARAFWGDARELWAEDAALARVLAFLRAISLEGDAFFLETSDHRGYLHFPFPSPPHSRGTRLADPVDPTRVRFVVRARGQRMLWRAFGGGKQDLGPDVKAAGWRTILSLRDLTVFERDTPHGKHRPLRLGVSEAEGWTALLHARRSVEANKAVPVPTLAPEVLRLGDRSAMAVALWTRGRLRGSAVCPPAPVLRATGQAASWACKDVRFAPLSAEDLAQTIVQVTFIHAPNVPLSMHEIATSDAYPDKAAFVSQGTRSGVYLPEIFNIRSHRTLRALTDSLAREKAGLNGFGRDASFEVAEVSEFIESADRTRAVRLEGPVAVASESESNGKEQRRMVGRAAAAWLAAIQSDDGAFPRRVHPLSGKADGVDAPRIALTALALAAFGTATGESSAIEAARRGNAWVDRREPQNEPLSHVLLTACYRGKAALCLGDDRAVEAAIARALERLASGACTETLVLAHAASFFRAVPNHRDASRRGEALERELEARFSRARRDAAPLSLAEWAELVLAFPPDSRASREVAEWLVSRQLQGGAFPSSTASDFVYSRGTGKVFEVLASRPRDSQDALERSFAWLASMQYRPDSMFFVPDEHRARVLGGLRHDAFDTTAWIDAAGHLLLGLARLETR
jgi:AMMECR1 domain-containing protein